jgi:hypothetical protein
MTYLVKVDYDDRDFLQIWLPEFGSDPFPKLEPGLYRVDSCVKLKGAKRAFDSIMIDGFSKPYPEIIAEVKSKEPPIEQESYDVPELDLYHVQLSTILETVYERFVAKEELSKRKVEAFV